MIQKSFKNSSKSLYLVSTPIGNLEDITFRAVRILKEVDIIYAEDTRVSLNLLNYYGIKKQVKSYHEFNKNVKNNEIIFNLKQGFNIALISDAGTPLISDPGFELVDLVTKNGFNIISIPGPTALISGLIVSNLPSRPFLFYGFLNNKESKRKEEILKLKFLEYTLIFYESPKRLNKTIKNLYDILGDRNVSIAREITKLYEEIIWDKLSNLVNGEIEYKGEIVLTVEGFKQDELKLEIDYIKEIEELINNNYSEMDAIKYVSKKYNLKKQDIYKEFQLRKE